MPSQWGTYLPRKREGHRDCLTTPHRTTVARCLLQYQVVKDAAKASVGPGACLACTHTANGPPRETGHLHLRGRGFWTPQRPVLQALELFIWALAQAPAPHLPQQPRPPCHRGD